MLPRRRSSPFSRYVTVRFHLRRRQLRRIGIAVPEVLSLSERHSWRGSGRNVLWKGDDRSKEARHHLRGRSPKRRPLCLFHPTSLQLLTAAIRRTLFREARASAAGAKTFNDSED